VAAIGWKTRSPTMRPDFRAAPKDWSQGSQPDCEPTSQLAVTGREANFDSTTAWAWAQAYWLDGFKRQCLPINARRLPRLVSEQRILQ